MSRICLMRITRTQATRATAVPPATDLVMKAMVSNGQCTSVFGCRLAGPDEFKPAKKTCKSKRLCDSYSTNF